jgi:hypothetical protein
MHPWTERFSLCPDHPLANRSEFTVAAPWNFLYLEIVLPPPASECGIYDHRMGEEIRVGSDDPALIVGFDDGRASLNFLHRSFVRIQLHLVFDPERLRSQKKQAGEEILQYVLKRETNRNATDTQDLDEIGHLEGGQRWTQLPGGRTIP